MVWLKFAMIIRTSFAFRKKPIKKFLKIVIVFFVTLKSLSNPFIFFALSLSHSNP